MDLRWLWIAIVLALAAGTAATPPAASQGEQSGVWDAADLLLPPAPRSQKRVEAPQRDARKVSHDRPHALPPLSAVPPSPIRVAITLEAAAPPGFDRASGSTAVARAPPGA